MRRGSGVSSLVTLILCVGIGSVSCTEHQTANEDTEDYCDPENTACSVTIGFISAETGAIYDGTEHWDEIIELVIRSANAAGGVIDGRQLAMVTEPDEMDVTRATAAAQSLIDQGAVAIIGPSLSEPAIAVHDVAAAAEVPYISATAASSRLNGGDTHDAHPWFFRTVVSEVLEGFVIASIAAGGYGDGVLSMGCESLAIAALEGDYGESLSAAIESRFTMLGGSVVASVSLESYDMTIEDNALQLRDSDPDRIALVTVGDEPERLLRAWHDAGGGETRKRRRGSG